MLHEIERKNINIVLILNKSLLFVKMKSLAILRISLASSVSKILLLGGPKYLKELMTLRVLEEQRCT